MATAVQPEATPDTARRVPGAEIHRRVRLERASYLAAATVVALLRVTPTVQDAVKPHLESGTVAVLTGRLNQDSKTGRLQVFVTGLAPAQH